MKAYVAAGQKGVHLVKLHIARSPNEKAPTLR